MARDSVCDDEMESVLGIGDENTVEPHFYIPVIYVFLLFATFFRFLQFP
jgi:hypothetical protein